MLRASTRRRNRRHRHRHLNTFLGLHNPCSTGWLDHSDSGRLAISSDHNRNTNRRWSPLRNQPQTNGLIPHFFVERPSSQDTELHDEHIFSCSHCEREIRVTSQKTVRKTTKISKKRLRANSSTTTKLRNAPTANSAPDKTRTKLL